MKLAEQSQNDQASTDQHPSLADQRDVLTEANRKLTHASAEERVRWALDYFGDSIVLTSSFGIQAAASLHLVTSQRPDIPVIVVDTGYLFPETYRFIDHLSKKFSLNLHTFRPELSPAWQEARFGKLWEEGLDGLERYNQLNKVEPMERALDHFKARAWIAGLRREQSSSRRGLSVLAVQDGRIKVHPIIDWSSRDVHEYLQSHQLPYHPLWEQGYVSVGDTHTSRPLSANMTEEETRFFGLKRECGIHEKSKPIDFSI